MLTYIWRLLPSAVLLTTTGCNTHPVYKYRYELTVVIQTPDGDKQSSSVIEVAFRENSSTNITGPGGITRWIKGEAVCVKIDKKRRMLALLRSESSAAWAESVMLAVGSFKAGGVKHWAVNQYENLIADRRLKTLPHRQATTGYRIGPRLRPMLVTFDNIADPDSIRRVDPDNLSATFGPGISLKYITVQITDKPVEFKNENCMPAAVLDPNYSSRKAIDTTDDVEQNGVAVNAFNFRKR
ncbi:hypothetical protein [Novosphingobium sp. 11B]